MEYNGRDLGEDLARTLQGAGYMVWTNQPLGSVQQDHVPVADVLAISKSYNAVNKIYEVKVSRRDFQGDVARGKYLSYLPFCHHFYFATPAKLIDKGELPEGCGLTVRGEKSWRSLKVAPRHDYQIDPNLLLALLMKGYQNHFEEYRRLEVEYLKNYPGLVSAAAKYGKRLSKDLVDASYALPAARELKIKIEKLVGRQFVSLDWAMHWLRGEVETLLGKYKYGEDAGELVEIALELMKGSPWQVEEKLRQIADKFKVNKDVASQ
jgi:hypothetical protein